MAAKRLGAHMPTSGGLAKAVRAGAAIGATAVQVFTSSPRQWKGRPAEPDAIAGLAAALAETGMEGAIVSHDTYLVNLCAPDEGKRAQSLACLTEELVRCGAFGIPYVVSHIGAAMGQDEETALTLASQGIREVLASTPDSVTLLMETTAGQGSSLHSRFDELARSLELCQGHGRLGVCLDTCHVFAAGYDIRTAEGWEAMMGEFHRLVGLDRLKVVHCNDSKMSLGSRKDRHAHLGEGEIGETAFRTLVKDSWLENVPILLETPDAETMHGENLRRLIDWAQG